ncbi:MAG: DNA mismatch repair protein MutS, partial [Nitrospirae bacterium]|nr:DNA mismatch repair protein MutS [Nitrospirota bacterium]
MSDEKKSELTPLLRQYQQIKRGCPDAILFFRLGDFYEMFYEDAVVASKVLEIALTTRDKRKEEPVPLCGIPYHAASSYIAKLIRSGFKVAICEQTEDPKQAKGIVKREIIRVITPGTVLDADLLEAKDNNYLTALAFPVSLKTSGRNTSSIVGMATADLSTGEFQLSTVEDSVDLLMQEISRIDPREILYSQDLKHPILKKLQNRRVYLHPQPPEIFHPESATHTLLKHFGAPALSSLNCEQSSAGVAAGGALLRFLQDTQKNTLPHITTLKFQDSGKMMGLDEIVQKNLGLVVPKASLFHLLDKTSTPMGGRMLRSWILHPLLDLPEIRSRHDSVGELLERFTLRRTVRESLEKISDLERQISRISLKTATPRDLVALAQSLAVIPAFGEQLGQCRATRLAHLSDSLSAVTPALSLVRSLIDRAIVDEPPASLGEGGVIREKYSEDLDEIRTISREGKGWITRLETSEKMRTGIDSLKIRYNRVFGYFIEVSKARLKDVPQDYIRKQTLANAERFITPLLKEYEDKVLGAEERSRELETRLFEEIRDQVSLEIRRIQKSARIIGEVDTFCSLAEAAHLYHYIRPHVHDGPELKIIEGKHPVVEQMNPYEGFIPNDTEMNCDDRQIMIITGPNMAGKSTYMRQVALIVLMAQMGSFVPAGEASIGLIDRIFTRIGASDNLVEGRSTFMVEMEETAEILRSATSRSLVLLDEIGRGTSTFDGISIAWAVAEYLRRYNRAKTLFATHYHELTELSLTQEGIFNTQMLVREWNDEVIFLRKLVDGPTDQSYGIQVARLAGLPKDVVSRAREILANLENEALNEVGVPKLSRSQQNGSPAETDLPQMALFAGPQHPVLLELQALDPMKMTPMEALI